MSSFVIPPGAVQITARGVSLRSASPMTTNPSAEISVGKKRNKVIIVDSAEIFFTVNNYRCVCHSKGETHHYADKNRQRTVFH